MLLTSYGESWVSQLSKETAKDQNRGTTTAAKTTGRGLHTPGYLAPELAKDSTKQVSALIGCLCKSSHRHETCVTEQVEDKQPGLLCRTLADLRPRKQMCLRPALAIFRVLRGRKESPASRFSSPSDFRGSENPCRRFYTPFPTQGAPGLTVEKDEKITKRSRNSAVPATVERLGLRDSFPLTPRNPTKPDYTLLYPQLSAPLTSKNAGEGLFGGWPVILTHCPRLEWHFLSLHKSHGSENRRRVCLSRAGALCVHIPHPGLQNSLVVSIFYLFLLHIILI